MTLHFYNATLADSAGEQFHATIFWDKLKRGKLTAHLCPRTGRNEYGYPVWSVTGANSRSGLTTLVAKLKRQAASMGLRFIEEGARMGRAVPQTRA